MARRCIPLPGGGFMCGVPTRSGPAQAILTVTYEECGHSRELEVGPRAQAPRFVGMVIRCRECGRDRRIASARVTARR